MAIAHLGLVLHAHLPDVRHDGGGGLEERWFFEAVGQCYLPLLGVFERLRRDGVRFRLTMSLSPPLCAMLDDDALLRRCARHFDALTALAIAEAERNRRDARIHRLAAWWRRIWEERRGDFERRGRRLLPAFRELADAGHLELIATAATHGHLPLLHAMSGAARAQIRMGIADHVRRFGGPPAGFWPPELAWTPGLEAEYEAARVRWICADAHAVLLADRRPRYGTFAPIVCPGGLVVFPRDAELARRVWSARDGYPGDPWYLEYHRDIGYERSPEALGALAPPAGARAPVGLKYWRVTGPADAKEVYEPARAEETARRHASDFVDCTLKRGERAAAAMERPPFLLAAFDAELFGHWWNEGPLWLEETLRRVAECPALRLTTPSEYLEMTRDSALQCATPADSSWGEGGGHETWWNERTADLWAGLHRAGRRLRRLARRATVNVPAVHAAARHFLLAQASDWPFMIRHGRAGEYGRRRWSAALAAVERCMEAAERGDTDDTAGPALFPDLDLSLFKG